MKLTKPKVRRVRITVLELEGGKAVPGSVHSTHVWDASAEEVWAIVEAALQGAARNTT